MIMSSDMEQKRTLGTQKLLKSNIKVQRQIMYSIWLANGNSTIKKKKKEGEIDLQFWVE